MKKKIILALILGILTVALTGCGKQQAERETASIAPKTHEQGGEHPDTAALSEGSIAGEFAGEWKANKVSNTFADERGTIKEYSVSVLTLHADGTGSLDDKSLTWEAPNENDTINVQFPEINASGAFGIREADGKTMLDFWGDVYYRSSDFVAKDTEILPD